jgi:hypothetical protein
MDVIFIVTLLIVVDKFSVQFKEVVPSAVETLKELLLAVPDSVKV